MRISKDKKQQRYQMVIYALQHGIKPTARLYATTPKTVRKWVKRFKEGGYQALNDISRRPKHSPFATPQCLVEKIIKLKSTYKRLGAEQIKILENLPVSAKTIRKIWRLNGLSSRKRRKKYLTKQNLRQIKKQYALFEKNCEDTKDLSDIPEYWLQMKKLNLPNTQYTFREISCGIIFLGFANERSLIHEILFAEYVNEHLKKYGLLFPGGIRQTDNGAEYCGSWSSKKPSAYTLSLEAYNQKHYTIPPGAHRYQSDVETVHNLMEMEFYEIENFSDRTDFFEKAYTYQLFFNLLRPNTYKENKSPFELAKEKIPSLPKEALMLAPVDLDALLDKKLANLNERGYDVPSGPLI